MSAIERLQTYDDLRRAPEDGLRRDLIDGVMLVNPAPRLMHQLVQENILELLRECFFPERRYRVLAAPVDLLIDLHNVVEPDIVVMESIEARRRARDLAIDQPPPLVVEILSPSSVRTDRLLKLALYARFGVPEYWIVDPEHQGFAVFALEGQGYVQIAARDDRSVESREFPGLVVRPEDVFFGL